MAIIYKYSQSVKFDSVDKQNIYNSARTLIKEQGIGAGVSMGLHFRENFNEEEIKRAYPTITKSELLDVVQIAINDAKDILFGIKIPDGQGGLTRKNTSAF